MCREKAEAFMEAVAGVEKVRVPVASRPLPQGLTLPLADLRAVDQLDFSRS